MHMALQHSNEQINTMHNNKTSSPTKMCHADTDIKSTEMVAAN